MQAKRQISTTDEIKIEKKNSSQCLRILLKILLENYKFFNN